MNKPDDICKDCGLARREHHHDGNAYGLCGQFSEIAHLANPRRIMNERDRNALELAEYRDEACERLRALCGSRNDAPNWADIATLVRERDELHSRLRGVAKTHAQISELDDASNACLELAAKHSLATGHGDTVGDMIREFSGQIRTGVPAQPLPDPMREALEFYADPNNWIAAVWTDDTCTDGAIPTSRDGSCDCGDRARKALSSLSSTDQECPNCNGTKRALYFSEATWQHEQRDCHVCSHTSTQRDGAAK